MCDYDKQLCLLVGAALCGAGRANGRLRHPGPAFFCCFEGPVRWYIPRAASGRPNSGHADIAALIRARLI